MNRSIATNITLTNLTNLTALVKAIADHINIKDSVKTIDRA
jgi:hypothetical protein